MKNLFNKINEKPRLKKALKIIYYVVLLFNVIWYFILNIALVVGAVSGVLDEEKEKRITNVATTPIKNIVYNDEYGVQAYFFLSDIMSAQFIEVFPLSIASMSTAYTNLSPYASGTDYAYWDRSASNPTTSLQSFVFQCNDGRIVAPYYTINSYRIEKTAFELQDNGCLFSRYLFTIRDSTDNILLQLQYDVVVAYRDNSDHELSGIQCLRITTLILSSYLTSLNNNWCIGENTLNTSITPLIRNYYNALPENADYQRGYKDGLTAGQGMADISQYRSGFNSGREQGYQEGIAYANEHPADRSAFDLLTSAFDSVASILNIHVLPGLTIGVLVFTPIIVAVIIVVVKMIKG